MEKVCVNIPMEMSLDDLSRLSYKAGAAGITVCELLSGYVGDLVDGIFTQGSDERHLASEYYHRCYEHLHYNPSFLSFLIDRGYDVEEVVGFYDDMQYHEYLYEDAVIRCTEYNEEDLMIIKDDLLYLKEEFYSYYNEYSLICSGLDVDEQMKICSRWLREKNLLREKACSDE